jgi:hypothetical protein
MQINTYPCSFIHRDLRYAIHNVSAWGLLVLSIIHLPKRTSSIVRSCFCRSIRISQHALFPTRRLQCLRSCLFLLFLQLTSQLSLWFVCGIRSCLEPTNQPLPSIYHRNGTVHWVAGSRMHPQLTSAASAAFLLASSCCALPPAFPADEFDPSVRGGPPTFFGTADVLVLLGGGAEERVRPG